MAIPPTPPGDPVDEDLLSAARRGDDAAFARLLEQHDPLLRRLVGVLVDHHDTDRVLSDAYVKAYRALGRSRGDAVTWLGRASYLTALDEVRRRERRRTGGPGRKPLTGPAPTPTIRLPPDQRAVLVLDEVLPSEAIATILATTPSTVGRLRSRGEPEAEALLGAEEEPATAEFWKGLGARLLAERAAPPAPPPRLEPPAVIPAPSARRDPPLAMQRRSPPAARRTAGPDPVEGLALGARRRRSRRRIDPRVVIGVVVVLAVAAALVAVIRLASEAASPVRENSVAEISGKVANALDAASFSATYTRTLRGQDGTDRAGYDVVRNDVGLLCAEPRRRAQVGRLRHRDRHSVGAHGGLRRKRRRDRGHRHGRGPTGSVGRGTDAPGHGAGDRVAVALDGDRPGGGVDAGRRARRVADDRTRGRDGGRCRPGGARGGQGPARPDERGPARR